MSTQLRKRRVLAFKPEVTPGTAVALTNAEALFVFDAEIQGEISPTDRRATGSLSKLASEPGGRKGSIKFKTEVSGSGTAGTAPHWAGLLAACGMTVTTGVYSFTSDPTAYTTITIGLYEQGVFKVLAGAMGTWKLSGESGKPMMIEWNFSGVWQPPTDASMLALPAVQAVAPRFAAVTMTIGGSSTPKFSKFSLDAGCKVDMLEDATIVAAFYRAIVTDRDTKGQFDPEATLVATYDPFGFWIAGTEQALSLTVGTVSGNTIVFAAPRAQRNNVQEGERSGINVNTEDFQINSTVAGDDELTITF